jgi:hypothetical protein
MNRTSYSEGSLFEKLSILYKQHVEQSKKEEQEEQQQQQQQATTTTTTTTTTTSATTSTTTSIAAVTSNKNNNKKRIHSLLSSIDDTGDNSSCENDVDKQTMIIFNSKIESLSDMMIFQSNLTDVANFYFDYVCFGTPLLTVKTVKSLIFDLSSATPVFDCMKYSSSLKKGDNTTNPVDMIIPCDTEQKRSELLLLFAILTFSLQRMGRRGLAQQMFDNTWNFLTTELSWSSSSVFENAEELINLSGCCILLGYYALAEIGDLNAYKVVFLMNQVNTYFATLNSSEIQLTAEQKQKVFFISRYMTQLLFLHGAVMEKDLANTTIKFFRRMSKRIDELGAVVTDDLLFLTQAQSVMKSQLSSKMTQHKHSLKVLVSSFDLSFLATRTQILRDKGDYCQSTILAQELSDKMSQFSQFWYCPLSIQYIITSSRIHLARMKSNDKHALKYLQKDLAALKRVASTYGIVEKKYSSLMREMTSIINDSVQPLYPSAKRMKTGDIGGGFLEELDMRRIFSTGQRFY